ncbi:MAG: DsbA family oxidoreductase, partial [Candidatus Dormibacteraceae bacterium]
MEIEVWSDVVCPWCYLGKRRLEHALEGFEHRDEVTVSWRSYELDPAAPREVDGDPTDRLIEKYGMSREQALESRAHLTRLAAEEGLEYHLERSLPTNTFDAHRLTRLAAAHGLAKEAVERLFRAYFTEGLAIGRPEVLTSLLTEIGVPEAPVRETLEGDGCGDEVRREEAQAARFGAQGVP